MILNITDKLRLEHDGYQWVVYEWRKGELIPKGRYKGRVAADKWVTLGKYFPRLDQALRFVITHEITTHNEELSLAEYLEEYSRLVVQVSLEYCEKKQ